MGEKGRRRDVKYSSVLSVEGIIFNVSREREAEEKSARQKPCRDPQCAASWRFLHIAFVVATNVTAQGCLADVNTANNRTVYGASLLSRCLFNTDLK